MNKIYHLLHQNSKPVVMGILNVTPDSFSDGGKFSKLDSAFVHAESMIEQGANIIDIGAESSRPGAIAISAKEERSRLEPILKKFKKEFSVPLSIDTYKPEIMELAIDYGVDMINDIYALQKTGALNVVSRADVYVCIMHMQGTPQDMQNSPYYSNIVEEITFFITNRISACEEAGISKDRLIIDPGFGFGKTYEHNIELFKGIKNFKHFSLPLLVGVSRKSMITKMIGEEEGDIIQIGAILAMLAVIDGAKIVRVHDVEETIRVLKILEYLESK